jgi:soluble lytic murein transglycosylase-like protein
MEVLCMRHLVATACLCLLTYSSSIAADQKTFQDRLGGNEAAAATTAPTDGVSVRAKDPAMPLDPQPLEQKPADLTTGMPGFAVLAEKPISIPEQNGTGDLLQPRALPAPPAKPKQVVNRSTEEVCDTLAQAAQDNKLPAPFFIRLLFQESGFKPGIVSHAGAQGIAQFMPETAASVGLDNPFDPLQAIPASARLLRNLIDKFGNLGLAAAAYNAGPKRIHDWLTRKGKLPSETQGYVKVITGRPADSWKGTKNEAIATKLPAQAPCKDRVIVAAADQADQVPAPAPAVSHKHVAAAVSRKHIAAAKKSTERKNTVNLAARNNATAAKKAEPKSTVSLAARKHRPRSKLAMR